MKRRVTPRSQRPAGAGTGTRTGWLPHPVLSTLLAGVWLLLQHSLDLPQLMFAALLGWALPRLLRGFLDAAPGPAGKPGTGQPETGQPSAAAPGVKAGQRLRLGRLSTIARLSAVVLHDIVAGNLAVAWLVLWPGARPKPGWVSVPLDLSQPDAILLLALVITNTPGTVSCVVDEAARQIVVHVLDLDDAGALVAQIKQRYEQPLQEIFR